MSMLDVLRKKAGVERPLALDGVAWIGSSSSRFLFRGVVETNESSRKRLLLEAGVRSCTFSGGDSSLPKIDCDGLLGVKFAFASMDARAVRDAFEAVDDRSSKRLKICPSFCGVGPRCIRTAAGVGSSSTSSSCNDGMLGTSNCELGFCGVAATGPAFLGVA